MKLNNFIILVMTLLVASLMCSCEIEDRVIELPPHDSKLVLNSQIFQGEDESKILLTESKSITDTFFKAENMAFRNSSSLTLYTPDQGAIEGYIYKEPNEFENVQLPLWTFDYNDYISGETYNIEAEVEGYDKITSEIIVPAEPDLVNVEVELKEAAPSKFFSRDKFEITINDPADEENYYYIKANFLINDNGFEYLRNYRFFDAPENPIDESFLENRITILNDKSFNGREHTFVAYGERGSYDFSEITFSIYQISKEAYEYQLAFENFTANSPFAEPITFPININGGYGIFSVTSRPSIMLIKL